MTQGTPCELGLAINIRILLKKFVLVTTPKDIETCGVCCICAQLDWSCKGTRESRRIVLFKLSVGPARLVSR